MSAPEIPPGWEASLDLLNEELAIDDLHTDQLLRLGNIHRRYIDILSGGLVDYVYAFARHQLRDTHQLPATGPYQAMLYQQMSHLYRVPIGGGLQYNLYVDDQPLAVRAQVYRISEDLPFEPLPPFDNEQAEEIYISIGGVRDACATRWPFLRTDSDLATIQGNPLSSRIVTVAPAPS